MHLTNHQCYSSSRFSIHSRSQCNFTSSQHQQLIFLGFKHESTTRSHCSNNPLPVRIYSCSLWSYITIRCPNYSPNCSRISCSTGIFQGLISPSSKNKRISSTQTSCLSPLSGSLLNPVQWICAMQVMVRSPLSKHDQKWEFNFPPKKDVHRCVLGQSWLDLRIVWLQSTVDCLCYPFSVKQC